MTDKSDNTPKVIPFAKGRKSTTAPKIDVPIDVLMGQTINATDADSVFDAIGYTAHDLPVSWIGLQLTIDYWMVIKNGVEPRNQTGLRNRIAELFSAWAILHELTESEITQRNDHLFCSLFCGKMLAALDTKKKLEPLLAQHTHHEAKALRRSLAIYRHGRNLYGNTSQNMQHLVERDARMHFIVQSCQFCVDTQAEAESESGIDPVTKKRATSRITEFVKIMDTNNPIEVNAKTYGTEALATMSDSTICRPQFWTKGTTP